MTSCRLCLAPIVTPDLYSIDGEPVCWECAQKEAEKEGKRLLKRSRWAAWLEGEDSKHDNA